MKKIIISIFVGTLILSLAACGNNGQDTSSEIKNSTEDAAVTYDNTEENAAVKVDTSWYEKDGMAICAGIYQVGTDLTADNYILTCKTSDYGMRVTIFESQEKYQTYYQSDRFTTGGENEAITANANSDEYVYEDNTYALNLKEGNILMISDGIGTLESADGKTEEKTSVIDGQKINVSSGTYQSGDIPSGTYMLSCTQSDYTLGVMVFQSKEAYNEYTSTDRPTVGDEQKAMEKNAWSNFVMQPGATVYLNITDGMVLQFINGNGQLEPVVMEWNPKK